MKSAQFFLFLGALTGAKGLLFRKHVFVLKYMSWFDAQTHCRQNYVDLSPLDSQEEVTKFKMDVGPNLLFRSWIGLNKRSDQMDYTEWSDGTVIGFIQWQSGKPDGRAIDHCVTAYNAELNDYGCANLIPFVCYTWEPTLILVRDLKTWYEALVHCRTQYTDLLSLTTDREFVVVNNKFKDIEMVSVWTGLNFLDGSWFWANSETVMNPKALPSCPSIPFRCGAKVGGILENANCMEKMSFICYQI